MNKAKKECNLALLKLEAKNREILYKLLHISKLLTGKHTFDPFNDIKEDYMKKPSKE
jgi:hypothetical protein